MIDRETTKFKPISEAPRNRTAILARDRRTGYLRVVYWNKIRRAWLLCGTGDCYYADTYFTDWMPLPEGD